MQRMHLRKLQIKLVKHAVYMYKDGREAEKSTWEKELAEYSMLQTLMAGSCQVGNTNKWYQSKPSRTTTT